MDLSSIDLNLLVAFEALMEERSVTGAAQRLYVGQPAMSAALGRLRTLFDDELFIRIGREMQPTAKALQIALGISQALQQIRHTIASSQTFDPATTPRRIAIGSSDYASCVVIPNLLAFCQRAAPAIDIRLIGFEKDSVGDLLEQGDIDLALGVFQAPPRQTLQESLFQERFVGIARTEHPAIANGTLSLETFASLSHALVTIRRDETGYIDHILANYGLQRRIAVTTPYMLVLPSLVAATDLITAIPSRIAAHLARRQDIQVFELPIQTEPWSISMMWSKLTDSDQANQWLRQTLKTVCDVL
ncbi:MAG: LysR family transcriptional regulator [Elainellaceae cyanobacterium]